MSFCIATLTHDGENRAEMLRSTVSSFLNHTILPPEKIDWFIYFNEINEQLRSALLFLQKEYKHQINFIVYISDINEGPGIGINKLNEKIIDYEYVLFIEGDWICLSEYDSGQSKNWLLVCLKIMKEDNSLDYFYLRRFFSAIDARQTGIHHYHKTLLKSSICKEDIKYFIFSAPLFTNNPIIRRNKRFYEKGVFPLQEFKDEIKTYPNWGKSENSACDYLAKNNLMLVIAHLEWGIFLHWDSINGYINKTTYEIENCNVITCSKYIHGKSTCKFGHFLLNQPHVCALCSTNLKSHEFHDIINREGTFLDNIENCNMSITDLEKTINTYNNNNPEVNPSWIAITLLSTKNNLK